MFFKRLHQQAFKSVKGGCILDRSATDFLITASNLFFIIISKIPTFGYKPQINILSIFKNDDMNTFSLELVFSVDHGIWKATQMYQRMQMPSRTEGQPLATNHFLGLNPTGRLHGLKLTLRSLDSALQAFTHKQFTWGASEYADSEWAGQAEPQDSSLPKGRWCSCAWSMGHVSSSDVFRDLSENDLILTDQVGREGRKLLFCSHVIQAFHFNGTLYIGIHNWSSHFGFLQDLLKVPKNNFLNSLEHKRS